jgi:hypothetical protein
MSGMAAVLAVVALAGAGLAGGQQRGKPLFEPAPGSPMAVGSGPADVVLGDVNGDARLDILTANTQSNNVSVLLGDGKGGFRAAPGSPFDAGPKPHLVALGDVNGDGAPDLAVTEHDSNDVRLFLGTGEGRFRPAPGSPFAALRNARPHNHGLSLRDLDGDGRLDIVTSNQDDNSVSVLFGDGKGGFAPAPGSPFAVGASPYPHAISDVNGDGRADIVTPNVRDHTLTVLLGDGHGGFAPAAGSPLATGHRRPFYVALGDVDGDARLDALVSHDDVTLVSVWLGDGKGGFRKAAASPVDIGHMGWKLVLADYNRDGKLDFAAGVLGNRVVVMLGDGRGGFTPAPGSPLAAGRGPWGVAAGDVNGDGKVDLVAANDEDGSVSVFLGR